MATPTIGAAAACLCFLQAANLCAQNNLVLRDLTLHSGFTVSRMDLDGLVVELPGQGEAVRFAWSDVLQGDVGEQQTAFDQFLTRVGQPLFRLRTKLAAREYRKLQDSIQALENELNSVDHETSWPSHVTPYLVLAAQFQSRLADGHRELAVAPLLNLLELRESHPALKQLDAETGIMISESGVVGNLLPIWFDPQAVKESLSQNGNLIKEQGNGGQAESKSLESKSRWLYFSSLKIAAEPSFDLTSTSWNELLDDRWRPILMAQSSLFNNRPDQARDWLARLPEKMEAEQQAMAVYYLGTAARLTSATVANADNPGSPWVLELLKVPATYQDQFPELSAAAIHQIVSDRSVDQATTSPLNSELVNRFGNTWHGRKWSSQTK